MVARGVAQGSSVKQIARQTGRSPNTVRAQLQSVMVKTGTHRQVDLALLLKQPAPPPPPPDEVN